MFDMPRDCRTGATNAAAMLIFIPPRSRHAAGRDDDPRHQNGSGATEIADRIERAGPRIELAIVHEEGGIRLDAYGDSFPNARLTRSESGVLEVVLHTDNGTLVFDEYTHVQFVDLFHIMGSDPDNRVVILTGTGQAFMESIRPEGFDFFAPQGYDKIYREGKKVLMNILDIEAPLIAALNGRVRLHSEYVLLADIALATPATVFQDKPHFEFRIVPGGGVRG